MPREAPEIRLIRETLEGVLHPSTASTVFFEALQATGGSLPRAPEQVTALVRGPLTDALNERLGEDMAASVLEPLSEQLEAVLAPRPRKPRKRPSRHDEPTRDLMLVDEVLPVFVLGGGPGFAAQLQATLGPHVMSAVTAHDLPTLRDRLAQIDPRVVLVDASDFPPIEPAELVDELARLPAEVVKAIFGADLPYGQSLLDAGQRAGLSLTPFDRREGVEPLMDLIRSRRA
ncbi:MAG TPA: hypothetical protein RMH99_27645 [Sandaracinaceae bacterium LLY-WYZ-13_1]|nr:hypothetical protein [Sandaracinaceae bacterium LLY-WYZ-13_1]